MTVRTATELDRDEIEAFLHDQRTGTLSLAKGDDSYAVPISYTYAAEQGDFYFRLGYAPGSRKREFIDSTDTATFVVAAETDEGWKSVVARGRLEHINTVDELARHRLPDEAISSADRELSVPFFNVFEEPTEMVFALVRLETYELTGVTEARGER